jgi:hypothetical protein
MALAKRVKEYHEYFRLSIPFRAENWTRDRTNTNYLTMMVVKMLQ